MLFTRGLRGTMAGRNKRNSKYQWRRHQYCCFLAASRPSPQSSPWRPKKYQSLLRPIFRWQFIIIACRLLPSCSKQHTQKMKAACVWPSSILAVKCTRVVTRFYHGTATHKSSTVIKLPQLLTQLHSANFYMRLAS